MARREAPWRCFEDEVYHAVERAVASGFLPFNGTTKVRRGAEYPVPSSGSTVKIEVSLEAFRQEATEPFLIWLWECKHKGTREVEVGDVRELHSKIQEIGVGRAKGSLVTTNGFQNGAIKLAQSLGISLYLLKKELVPILKYGGDDPEELREVIVAERTIDFSGKEHSEMRFDERVRYGIRQVLSESE
jgi:hypothetical protein